MIMITQEALQTTADQFSEDSDTLRASTPPATILSAAYPSTDQASHRQSLTLNIYQTSISGDDIITELQQAADDLALLVHRFGRKMAAILQWPKMKGALLAEPHMLGLPCLGQFDSFNCVSSKIFDEPIMQSGKQPMLYWLYDLLLYFLEPSGVSKGARLQLTPNMDLIHQLGQLPAMDIELMSKHGKPFIQLTLCHGGKYDQREVLSAPIWEASRKPTMRYGKPIPVPADSMDVDVNPMQEGISAVLSYLVPRRDSRWRIAMYSFPEDSEEEFYTNLVHACKAEDDTYFVSDEENKKCHGLFERFPAQARNFLQGRIGARNGPFSRQAFERDWRD
ncbi:hypothetical protein BGZ63DRAFT_429594 [Mariannaea sp. PMI_226]|nr:hypothetical protein BGZ63DRAFT_429594 [Mariannaea sp. PMI_226]